MENCADGCGTRMSPIRILYHFDRSDSELESLLICSLTNVGFFYRKRLRFAYNLVNVLAAHVMARLTIQSLCLLTCLLSLPIAIPNSLTLLPTSLLEDASGNNLTNTTLAAVIPKDFTITPSVPLDEPLLDRRGILLLALQLLGTLGLDDYNGEQEAQAWHRQPQDVYINIAGPLLTAESPVAARKYVLWGVYKVAHSMVAYNDFRPRNYEMLWEGTLVGFLSFNNGPQPAPAVAGGSANETRTAIQQGRSSISRNTLPLASPAHLSDTGVEITFRIHGHTILESDVFMTLFTGILKLAPLNPSDPVVQFLVNTRPFNTVLSFEGQAGLYPSQPYFEYRYLVEMLMQLPAWVLEQQFRFAETEMVVTVNDKTVGAGVMQWRESGTVGAGDVGTVLSS